MNLIKLTSKTFLYTSHYRHCPQPYQSCSIAQAKALLQKYRDAFPLTLKDKAPMNPKDLILMAAKLPTGNELFLPTEHKKEQAALRTSLSLAGKDYSKNIDPEVSFLVKRTFKDNRLWVVVQKLSRPKAVWEKGPTGHLKKHILGDPRRIRLEKQMIEDGIPEKEREKLLEEILKEV